MAQVGVRRQPDAPWSLRLFERVPLAPAWTGLMISAAWFAVYLVYAYSTGLGSWLGGAFVERLLDTALG